MHFLIFLKLHATVIQSVKRNGIIFDVCVLLYDLEVLKSFSFEGCFHLGNRKNSAGAESGEWDRLRITTPRLASKSFTIMEEWALALSYKRNRTYTSIVSPRESPGSIPSQSRGIIGG